MNLHTFQMWLDAYKDAWEHRDPQAAATIFAANATYRETPFDEPMQGRQAIFQYWSDVTRSQEQVKFDYEILAVAEGRGIARWRASFRRVASTAHVRLDGIFIVYVNEETVCTRFEEWWHMQEKEGE